MKEKALTQYLQAISAAKNRLLWPEDIAPQNLPSLVRR